MKLNKIFREGIVRNFISIMFSVLIIFSVSNDLTASNSKQNHQQIAENTINESHIASVNYLSGLTPSIKSITVKRESEYSSICFSKNAKHILKQSYLDINKDFNGSIKLNLFITAHRATST
jgi:hypothetical protein